jgi:hypothetical protein
MTNINQTMVNSGAVGLQSFNIPLSSYAHSEVVIMARNKAKAAEAMKIRMGNLQSGAPPATTPSQLSKMTTDKQSAKKHYNNMGEVEAEQKSGQGEEEAE